MRRILLFFLLKTRFAALCGIKILSCNYSLPYLNIYLTLSSTVHTVSVIYLSLGMCPFTQNTQKQTDQRKRPNTSQLILKNWTQKLLFLFLLTLPPCPKSHVQLTDSGTPLFCQSKNQAKDRSSKSSSPWLVHLNYMEYEGEVSEKEVFKKAEVVSHDHQGGFAWQVPL